MGREKRLRFLALGQGLFARHGNMGGASDSEFDVPFLMLGLEYQMDDIRMGRDILMYRIHWNTFGRAFLRYYSI